MSPYLSQLAELRWRLRATEAWNSSASWLWASESMPLTFEFVGSLWSWSSANWIFLLQDLTHAPCARLFSFASRLLQLATLSIASSSHSAQSQPKEGRAASPA